MQSPSFRRVPSRRVPTFCLAGALALASSLAAQPPQKGAKTEILQTANGHPDLSGTYDTATLTPLVRPPKYGNKLFLTEEEALEIEEKEQALLDIAAQQSDPERDAPKSGGSAPVGYNDQDREVWGSGNVGGYNLFWIDRGDSAFEIDGVRRTSIITEPPNGQYPEMAAGGLARMSAIFSTFRRGNDGSAWWVHEDGAGPYDGPEMRPMAERCLLGFGSTQGPPMLPVLYNNHKRIVQTKDHVMILVEMVHDARIIRMNAEHNPPDVREWLGDSVGHWDGDTLVVDTTNFTDSPGLYAASRNLHVVERFSRLDSKNLLYEFTVDDPDTWQTSWSGSYNWPETGERVYEYGCHEGNYALGSVLKGARILEAEELAKGDK